MWSCSLRGGGGKRGWGEGEGWRTGSGKIPDWHPSPADFTSAPLNDKKPQYAPLTLRTFPSEITWNVECVNRVCQRLPPPPHTEHSLDIYEAEWGDIKAKLHVDIFNIKSYFSLFLVVRTCRPKQSPECVTADAFNDIISMAGSNGNKGTCCLFMGMALRAAVCAVIHRL